MGLLIGGIMLIISTLLVAMLTPLVFYFKREKRWMEAGKTIEAWYEP